MRESWDSWSGAGGGGPGVGGCGGEAWAEFGSTGGRFKRGSCSPRGSGSSAVNGTSVVAARDLDLEKLGGSYR